MPSTSIRFYAELNDYLPNEKRYAPFVVSTTGSPSINDLISSLGVPIAEVDLVLVNGESVNLRHVIKENDRISVYPVYESFDISSVTRVRNHPHRKSRIVLDSHLGKLAYYLRMLGFDTLYRPDFHDDELVSISNNDQRILLSRDRKLIEESPITRAYRIHATDPKLQAVEVLRRFDLFHATRPLQRCLRCNDFLHPIAKVAVLHRLPPMIRERHEEFQTCLMCNRVYWKGLHYQRMQAFVAGLLTAEQTPNWGNEE